MFTYQTYGLVISSEIEIPEFLLSLKDPDIYIRFGEFRVPCITANEPIRVIEPSKNGILLYWNRIGGFLIEQGNTITISPIPNVDQSLIRLVLTGPALGVLLHQRGSSVFHASVISEEKECKAVAFLARKGEGKSTMAAAMYNHGYRLMSDDLMAVTYSDEGTVVQSGFPQTKLWSESADILVHDAAVLRKLGPDFEKRSRPITERFREDPALLMLIFVLEFGEGLNIEPVNGKDALKALLPHWYGALFSGQLIDFFGRDKHFFECAQIARNIPVLKLTRPHSFSLLQDVVDMVDSYIKT